MKKKILFVFIAIIATLVLYRTFQYDLQEYLNSRHIIKWSENVKINFKNYEGKPQEYDQFNIHSYHGIYLKSNSFKDVYAVAFFDKRKSWIIDSTSISAEDRALIQIRFNLHEYYTRLINSEIDEMRNDQTKEFKDLEKIYNRKYSELKDLEQVLFNKRNISKKSADDAKKMVDSLMMTVPLNNILR